MSRDNVLTTWCRLDFAPRGREGTSPGHYRDTFVSFSRGRLFDRIPGAAFQAFPFPAPDESIPYASLSPVLPPITDSTSAIPV